MQRQWLNRIQRPLKLIFEAEGATVSTLLLAAPGSGRWRSSGSLLHTFTELNSSLNILVLVDRRGLVTRTALLILWRMEVDILLQITMILRRLPCGA